MIAQATAYPRLVRGATRYDIIFDPTEVHRAVPAPAGWGQSVTVRGLMYRGDTPCDPDGEWRLYVEVYTGQTVALSTMVAQSTTFTLKPDHTMVKAQILLRDDAGIFSPASSPVAALRTLLVTDLMPGKTGPQGAVLRFTEWAKDRVYFNGLREEDDPHRSDDDYLAPDDADGILYLDVVRVTGPQGHSEYFQCKRSHESTDGPVSTSNKTGNPYGTGGTAYWEAFNDQTRPIYTPVLLADNARIEMLTGQEIVWGMGPDLWGRLGAPVGTPGYVMWTGAATAEDATFTLDREGKAYWGDTDGGDWVCVDPWNGSITISDSNHSTVLDSSVYDSPQGLRLSDVITDTAQTNVGKTFRATDATGVVCGSFRLLREAKVRASVPVSVVAQNSGNWRATVSAHVEVLDASGNVVKASYSDFEINGYPQASNFLAREYGRAAVSTEAKLQPGTYTVRVTATIWHRNFPSLQPSTSGYTSQGEVRILKGLTVTSTDREGVFEARYYGNGHYVGIGMEDYVTAWQDGGRGMAFEALNGAGFGIGVDADGLRVMHGGGWFSLPDYIKAVIAGEIK